MEINDLADRLTHHESASQKRFEQLHHAIKEGKHMSETARVNNVFETPMGGWGGGYGGAGLGAGAGGLAGIAGGVLGGALTRGGLFGNDGRVGEGHVTPTQLTAALAGVQDQNSFSALMQGQARIEGAIPAAEGAMQLALSQSQGQVMNQIGQQSLAIAQGFGNTSQQISTAQAAVIAVGESIKDTVNSTSSATQLGIANLATSGLQNTFALSQAVSADGDKTRALIESINSATLNRQLTVADLDRRDEANRGRIRETEINISNVNTANAQQAQAQSMQQNQWQAIIQLAESVRNLCGDVQAVRQTQSQVVFGNNIGSGQAANATNNSVR